MTLLSILGVLSSAIFSGTSLLYTTLGEVDRRTLRDRQPGSGRRAAGQRLGRFRGDRTCTGNPYLGVLVAMLAGGLMNMILGYLVITRQANQLASGLALMFFGFGLSALIGKPYVGAKIDGLPRLASARPLRPARGCTPPSFSFDLLIYLVIPMAILVWWLLFRTRWGLGVRAVGENADTAFASGRNPRLHPLPGAVRGRAAGRPGRSASLDRLYHELDRIHDRRPRLHRRGPGHLLQVASRCGRSSARCSSAARSRSSCCCNPAASRSRRSCWTPSPIS